MKKIIFGVLSVIMLLITIGFCLFILPFTGTKKVQAGNVFADRIVFNVVDGMSQVFIINGGNREVALIDAGNSADGKQILDVLSSYGLKNSDVKAIFLTHGHHDHIAAAKIFSNARIYSLKDEVEYAEGLKKYNSPIGRCFSPESTGLKVTNILKDGDSVTVGSQKVDVFAIPGHTEGGAAYLSAGVLFLGDAALSSGDGKIKDAVWVFSDDVEQQKRSLKALAGRLFPVRDSIKNIVFAHSGPLDGVQPLIDYAGSIK